MSGLTGEGLQEQVTPWLLLVILGISVTKLTSRRSGDREVTHTWSKQEPGMGTNVPLRPFKPLFKHGLSLGGGTMTPARR